MEKKSNEGNNNNRNDIKRKSKNKIKNNSKTTKSFNKNRKDKLYDIQYNKPTSLDKKNISNKTKIKSKNKNIHQNEEKKTKFIFNNTQLLTEFIPNQFRDLKIRNNEDIVIYLDRLYCILKLIKLIKEKELSNLKEEITIKNLKKETLITIDIINTFTLHILYNIQRAKIDIDGRNINITHKEMQNFLFDIKMNKSLYNKLKYSIYHNTNIVDKKTFIDFNPLNTSNINIHTFCDTIKDTDKNIKEFIEIKKKLFKNKKEKSNDDYEINNIITNKDSKDDIYFNNKIIKEQIKETAIFRTKIENLFKMYHTAPYSTIQEIHIIEKRIYEIINIIYKNYLNKQFYVKLIMNSIFNLQQINYTYIINNKTYNILEHYNIIKYYILTNMNSNNAWNMKDIDITELSKNIRAKNYKSRYFKNIIFTENNPFDNDYIIKINKDESELNINLYEGTLIDYNEYDKYMNDFSKYKKNEIKNVELFKNLDYNNENILNNNKIIINKKNFNEKKEKMLKQKRNRERNKSKLKKKKIIPLFHNINEILEEETNKNKNTIINKSKKNNDEKYKIVENNISLRKKQNSLANQKQHNPKNIINKNISEDNSIEIINLSSDENTEENYNNYDNPYKIYENPNIIEKKEKIELFKNEELELLKDEEFEKKFLNIEEQLKIKNIILEKTKKEDDLLTLDSIKDNISKTKQNKKNIETNISDNLINSLEKKTTIIDENDIFEYLENNENKKEEKENKEIKNKIEEKENNENSENNENKSEIQNDHKNKEEKEKTNEDDYEDNYENYFNTGFLMNNLLKEYYKKLESLEKDKINEETFIKEKLLDKKFLKKLYHDFINGE